MEYLRIAQHLRRCFHRSAHRQGSSLRSQPCPIKSKSPTGIVAHATGLYFPRGMQPYAGDLYGDCRTRNWAARNIPRGMQPHADDLYGDCRTRNRAARNVPRGMQPHADDLYGDCPTRNWAERNVPRGIQPHADDPLRGLSHMQLGGTKCPALHTTRRHEISHMHFSDADIPVIVLTANKIYPRNPQYWHCARELGIHQRMIDDDGVLADGQYIGKRHLSAYTLNSQLNYLL